MKTTQYEPMRKKRVRAVWTEMTEGVQEYNRSTVTAVKGLESNHYSNIKYSLTHSLLIADFFFVLINHC